VVSSKAVARNHRRPSLRDGVPRCRERRRRHRPSLGRAAVAAGPVWGSGRALRGSVRTAGRVKRAMAAAWRLRQRGEATHPAGNRRGAARDRRGAVG
jgi:hypothetical protein